MTSGSRLAVPFDWNTVTPEAMSALVEGIAECIDWDNPMVTNESGMELLRYLHHRGFSLAPLALADADDALDALAWSIDCAWHTVPGVCDCNLDIGSCQAPSLTNHAPAIAAARTRIAARKEGEK